MGVDARKYHISHRYFPAVILFFIELGNLNCAAAYGSIDVKL